MYLPFLICHEEQKGGVLLYTFSHARQATIITTYVAQTSQIHRVVVQYLRIQIIFKKYKMREERKHPPI